MRITGGSYKGRKIICPPGEIRPAMDRMRESLFAILGDISGDSFLDLFSGSGVVGIEAASRGAFPVVLVEADKKKRNIIVRNISFADPPLSLYMISVERFIPLSSQENRCFDYIYIDPPFRWKHKDKIIQSIIQNKLAAPSGTLIIHHPRQEICKPDIPDLQAIDNRQYGGSTLTFFSYQPNL